MPHANFVKVTVFFDAAWGLLFHCLHSTEIVTFPLPLVLVYIVLSDTMPVSSRKPPPGQQPYLRPVPLIPGHPHSREPSPAPPYNQPHELTNGQYAAVDPFQDSRSLAYGSSHPYPINTAPINTAPISFQPQHPSPIGPAGQVPLYQGSGPPTPSRLPFFEAALARSRGEVVPDHQPHFPSAPPPAFNQPSPSYLPPPDPNHPDIAVGFTQSSTVRFALGQGRPYGRELSRSPSPGMDESFDHGFGDDSDYAGEKDVEKALLFEEEEKGYDPRTIPYAMEERGWNEKLSSLGLMGAVDEGDLSLPPFRGTAPGGPLSAIPSIHVRGPTTSTTRSQGLRLPDGEMAPSSTQHFGPAPDGRLNRRTYNEAGHRRIKQTATLDDNGFFAVDMPIPTRLAQFLPVKGVEEQKSTRSASRFA